MKCKSAIRARKITLFGSVDEEFYCSASFLHWENESKEDRYISSFLLLLWSLLLFVFLRMPPVLLSESAGMQSCAGTIRFGRVYRHGQLRVSLIFRASPPDRYLSRSIFIAETARCMCSVVFFCFSRRWTTERWPVQRRVYHKATIIAYIRGGRSVEQRRMKLTRPRDAERCDSPAVLPRGRASRLSRAHFRVSSRSSSFVIRHDEYSSQPLPIE